MSTPVEPGSENPEAETTPEWACPRCGTSLDSTLRCTACRVDFPMLGAVPWLFAEPQAALAEWRNRIDFALQSLERDAAGARRGRERAQSESARQRLDRLERAFNAQRAAIADLLAPMAAVHFERPIEVHLALRTRLPTTQALTSYYPNLFRDWCWGETENAASLELIEPRLVPGARVRLVLGAGAGRLAYDVQAAKPARTTVALDFNPLLVLVGERVARGECVRLYEMPIAPRSAADTAVERELRAPRPADAGLRFVLADALRAPLRAGSVDELLTPWFVDVVEEDFPVLARRMNSLLRPGGHWLLFGSLAFTGPDALRHYSREEIDEHVENAGFEIAHAADAEIPYMSAPGSRHARRERVVALSAIKRKDVAPPERHVALPDWIVRNDRPVPLLPSFRTQAMTTRIYAFVMSLVDGRRTLGEMARHMEQQRLMPAAEAEAAIRGFLTSMYDESRAPPR